MPSIIVCVVVFVSECTVNMLCCYGDLTWADVVDKIILTFLLLFQNILLYKYKYMCIRPFYYFKIYSNGVYGYVFYTATG